MSLIGIIESGDVVGAVKKIWSLIFGTDMPSALADLVSKFATTEGKVVWNAATTFLSEIGTKGLQQAATDGWEIIKDQVPSMALTDLQDAMGIQARSTTSAASPVVPAAS